MIFLNSFEEIQSTDIEQLQNRGVQEHAQLDFKRELLPLNQDNKYELLKDVSAMANSDGGILIYGVDQDSEGRIASITFVYSVCIASVV